MRSILKSGKINWIDIQSPSEDDINFLKKNYKFHPLVLEELTSPSLRPFVEYYSRYLFMVFYYPLYNKKTGQTAIRELDIIVSKNTLITSHYQTILPLKRIFFSCSLNPKRKKVILGKGTGYLLFHILDSFWNHCLNKLTRINNNIELIEKKIFQGKEKEMVKEILYIKTDIIGFKRIIGSQKEVLESLYKEGGAFFGKDLSHYFIDVLGTFTKVWNTLQAQKENILALEDTNQSLLSTKINEIMKVLTIFSVVLMPLTLITGIWGMNFVNLPLSKIKLGFWIIIGTMLLIMTGMILYFKKKKWL